MPGKIDGYIDIDLDVESPGTVKHHAKYIPEMNSLFVPDIFIEVGTPVSALCRGKGQEGTGRHIYEAEIERHPLEHEKI